MESFDKTSFNFSLEYNDMGNSYCPLCTEKITKMGCHTWKPFCDCGWSGCRIEMLSYSEALTKKRMELIDNILKKN